VTAPGDLVEIDGTVLVPARDLEQMRDPGRDEDGR
jgi:hypothetical protein